MIKAWLGRMRNWDLHQWLAALPSLGARLKSRWYYPRIFGSFGRGSILYRPILISNPRHIHIGRGVTIRPGARLEAVIAGPASCPEIRIGDNVNIEQNVHIVAVGKVIVGESVGISAMSSLLGGTHPYFDIHDPVPIRSRLAGEDSLLEIGAGSFLGIGSVIQMNVRLGRQVVVGSNTVVKCSAPDFCVLNGNPAEIVLAYDASEQRWKRPKRRGTPAYQ